MPLNGELQKQVTAMRDELKLAQYRFPWETDRG